MDFIFFIIGILRTNKAIKMDALFEMIKSIERDGTVVLPIDKIHDIKVYVDIEKKVYTRNCDCDEVMYYFHIRDNYYCCEDRYNYYFKSFEKIKTDIQIKLMLECCVRFIKNCKVDKLVGMFVIDEDNNVNVRAFEKLVGLFEDMEHVKTSLNRCCVCHDWTHTKLKECSHPVCLECLIKLEEKECEECYGDDPTMCCDKCRGLERIRTCPMCREYIIEGIE